MPTLVMDPPPTDFETLLERRRRLGQDRHDEMWEGVLHMAPASLRRHARLQMQIGALLEPLSRAAGLEALGEFNVGDADNHRIPDCGLLAPGPDALYLPTAALIVEILSPNDETREKLPFYAAHHVDELLIVDPEQRSVEWLGLTGGEYHPIERSALIDLSVAELSRRIDWP
ncbi:MAG TPA: Uma2 family endonuclease [Solirubrobacteraceae bacterium]